MYLLAADFCHDGAEPDAGRIAGLATRQVVVLSHPSRRVAAGAERSWTPCVEMLHVRPVVVLVKFKED